MTAATVEFGHGSRCAFEGAWVVLAIVAHAAFIAVLPKVAEHSDAETLSDAVDMSFVAAAAKEAQPEEIEVAPTAVRPPPRKIPRVVKRPSRPKVTAGAAQETPVEFDNVVLTEQDEGDSSWSSEEGSGEPVEEPIGSPNAAVTGESKMGVSGGVIGGTGKGIVIDTGDLSREPLAPPMNPTLKRLAPDRTGAIGVEGEAFIRLRISVDGVPSEWKVMLEHPSGYALGQRCIETLKKEAWHAPVGDDGKPVVTRVLYRCGYEIRY